MLGKFITECTTVVCCATAGERSAERLESKLQLEAATAAFCWIFWNISWCLRFWLAIQTAVFTESDSSAYGLSNSRQNISIYIYFIRIILCIESSRFSVSVIPLHLFKYCSLWPELHKETVHATIQDKKPPIVKRMTVKTDDDSWLDISEGFKAAGANIINIFMYPSWIAVLIDGCNKTDKFKWRTFIFESTMIDYKSSTPSGLLLMPQMTAVDLCSWAPSCGWTMKLNLVHWRDPENMTSLPFIDCLDIYYGVID